MLVLLLTAGAPAAAQELQGRVLRAGTGVGGIELELHRVSRDTAGVVARSRSELDGRFSFRLPPAQSTGFTVFFATAEHLGVRYFGAPLHPGDPHEGYTIEVFDTTSAAGAAEVIGVSRRDVVLLQQGAGGWEVNEVLRIENPGERTLVSTGGKPTWGFRIPAGATDFEVGEGEVTPAEVVRMADRVLLLIPLLPGSRELFVRYRIPPAGGEFLLPVDAPTAALNLYVREPAPDLAVDGLAPQGSLRIEDEAFLSYSGTSLERGADVRVMTTSLARTSVDPSHAAMIALALLLGFGVLIAVRQRGREPPATAPLAPDQAAGEVASPDQPG